MAEENHDHQHEQEEKLLQKFNQARTRVFRNRLLLVTVLNVITFVSFVFAMTYYRWIWVKIQFRKGHLQNHTFQFWINLLYVREDKADAHYQSFTSAEGRVCSDDPYCLTIFHEFQSVGCFCFGILLIAGCLQLFDFLQMVYFLIKSGKIIETKDNFRHLFTIFTYFLGLILSAFSIDLIQSGWMRFGISFWISVITLCCFVGVIVYEQISVRKMVQQSMILDLIQKEKKVRLERMKQNLQKSKESVKEDQRLTL